MFSWQLFVHILILKVVEFLDVLNSGPLVNQTEYNHFFVKSGAGALLDFSVAVFIIYLL